MLLSGLKAVLKDNGDFFVAGSTYHPANKLISTAHVFPIGIIISESDYICYSETELSSELPSASTPALAISQWIRC